VILEDSRAGIEIDTLDERGKMAHYVEGAMGRVEVAKTRRRITHSETSHLDFGEPKTHKTMRLQIPELSQFGSSGEEYSEML
jgi:hypothetical protein